MYVYNQKSKKFHKLAYRFLLTVLKSLERFCNGFEDTDLATWTVKCVVGHSIDAKNHFYLWHINFFWF